MKKLVRDRIPEIIEANGETPHVRILDDDELRTELKKKLAEEAKEASLTTSREELIEELADIEEVLEAVRESFHITTGEVEAFAHKKRDERGGFGNKIFLEEVT